MKQFRPIRESLVRGDNRAGLLIAVGNEPEEQIALFPVYGGIANLVHDDQGGLVIASAFSRASGFMIFSQLLDQVLHVGKIDADPCLAGFQGQGHGKTYLACALAQRACRSGFSALYLRLPSLFQQLALARADGSYPRLLKRIGKAKVLVLDDWGIAPMTAAERRDLFEVIEERHGISSTIVATQLPVNLWHENIRDPTIADAILDRIVHCAHRIELKGESMRKRKKTLTDEISSGT